MPDRLARKLRLARKTAGFTQEQMAHKIGVSLRTYTRWESSETKRIPMRHMYAICAATRHDLSFFMRGAMRGEYE